MRISTLIFLGVTIALSAGCGSDEDTEPQSEMESMEMMAEGDDAMSLDDSGTMEDAGSIEPSMSEPETDIGDSDDGMAAQIYGPDDIVVAITDRDQLIRLILTPSNVTMKLSAESMGRLRSQVSERGLKDDLKKAMLESIQEVALAEVESALDDHRMKRSRHQIRYPLETVNSIHYQSDRLWIDLKREKALSFDDIRTPDGRPVLANFDAQDAIDLVAAFESLRR